MNPNDFGDLQTFTLAQPTGWHVWLNLQNILKTTECFTMKSKVKVFIHPAEYLYIYSMDWHNILYRHSWFLDDES